MVFKTFPLSLCNRYGKGRFEVINQLRYESTLDGSHTMRNALTDIRRLIKDREAVTALEYGIIAGVLGLTLIVIFTTFGTTLKTLFTTIGTKI
jgi:pilus assembly protein Flp/PilA